MRHVSSATRTTPTWATLARRFPGDEECLATFLALEAAAVLEGLKPALLVSIANRHRPCGRNLHPLWHRYGAGLLQRCGLRARALNATADALLLLIYHPQTLSEQLARPGARGILRKAGYHTEPDRPVDALLDELATRFSGEGTFPHEVGVFLGYPLKDVAGFLGWGQLTLSGQGPWKYYGDPQRSVTLAEQFGRCRCSMARRLAGCATPLACLGPVGPATRRDCAAAVRTDGG